MPSTSSRMRPSDARGAPRRGAVGADRSGKSPDAIMPNRSSAQSLNVICCRDGVRVSPRFVCRVSTPIVSGGSSVAGAHDRHGAHARGRLLEPVRRGRVDDPPALERLAHLRAPLRPHAIADDVAIEQGRRTARAGVRDGDERVVFGRHPDHDVGEREVGEQLTVAGEAVEPLDVGFARPALGVDEIAEGRHPSSLEASRVNAADRRRRLRRPARARVRRTSACASDLGSRMPRRRRARRPRPTNRRTASVIGDRGATSAIGRAASSAASADRGSSARTRRRSMPPKRSSVRRTWPRASMPERAGAQPVRDDGDRRRADRRPQLGVRPEEAGDAERVGRRDGDDEVGACAARPGSRHCVADRRGRS